MLTQILKYINSIFVLTVNHSLLGFFEHVKCVIDLLRHKASQLFAVASYSRPFIRRLVHFSDKFDVMFGLVVLGQTQATGAHQLLMHRYVVRFSTFFKNTVLQHFQ